MTKNKYMVKGLSLVEILVVIFIISILIVASSATYNRQIFFSKVETVETELAGWMSDINQYMEDFGPFTVDINDNSNSIKNKDEFLAFLYYNDKSEVEEVIGKGKYISESPLGILASYFTIDTTVEDAEFEDNSHYVRLRTKSKKDPWDTYYKLILNTDTGVIIVYSCGPNNVDESEFYRDGKFDEIDDIILLVDPK